MFDESVTKQIDIFISQFIYNTIQLQRKKNIQKLKFCTMIFLDIDSVFQLHQKV